MTSTAAFFIARLVGLLAAAVATLAVAVGVLGLGPAQATRPATTDDSLASSLLDDAPTAAGVPSAQAPAGRD